MIVVTPRSFRQSELIRLCEIDHESSYQMNFLFTAAEARETARRLIVAADIADAAK